MDDHWANLKTGHPVAEKAWPPAVLYRYDVIDNIAGNSSDFLTTVDCWPSLELTFGK